MTSVRVLGAGIVGICCALMLRKAGFDVILQDQNEPVQKASRWNAGVLATSSLIPLNNPTLFSKLSRLMTGKMPGFQINSGHLFKNLMWGQSFLRHSSAYQASKAIDALNALITPSFEEHITLAEECAIQDLYKKKGWIFAWPAYEGAQASRYHLQIYEKYQVPYDILDWKAMSDLEPSLKPVFKSGIYFPTSINVVEPYQVAMAYFAYFLRLGGQFEKQKNVALSHEGGRSFVVSATGEKLQSDHIVIAAGSGSAALLRTLGLRLPLVAERGYVSRYRLADDHQLNRSVFDCAGALVLSPRPDGVQISTGSELAQPGSLPANNLMGPALERAQDILHLDGPVEGKEASAERPTLPDSLPAIGALQSHSDVWLCCGHQHVGFSTAPASAKHLVSLMTARSTRLVDNVYSPARFGL